MKAAIQTAYTDLEDPVLRMLALRTLEAAEIKSLFTRRYAHQDHPCAEHFGQAGRSVTCGSDGMATVCADLNTDASITELSAADV